MNSPYPNPSAFDRNFRFPAIGLALAISFLLFGQTVSAAVLDVWRADDLSALDNGDAVGSWNSMSNRLATAAVGSLPLMVKNATVSGKPSVHFDNSRMTIPSSPVGGLNAFSLVVVFKADQAGVNDKSGWSGKTGIVDANETGTANDWGFAIRDTSFICFGTGGSSGDQTVYLDNLTLPNYPVVVDGKYHVAVSTWGAGSQTLYLDNLPGKTQSGVSTLIRNDAGLSFGGTHTGESTHLFTGDLAEVQFHSTALSAAEVSALIAQLSDTYLTNHGPAIVSFTASTNFLSGPGMPVTFSWAVSNATSVTIDNNVGTFFAPTGSVQTFPPVTALYTLTASNAYGTTASSITVTQTTDIPTAYSQSLTLVKNTTKNITLTGVDPQGSSLTFAMMQSPQHGGLSGIPPAMVYTPSNNYVGADFFTFRASDGTNFSAPASVQLYVDDLPQPPHGIFLNTTKINATATAGSFLALLRAVDTNLLDTFTFSLVAGAGATNNGKFTISGNQLLAGAGFPVTPGTNLYLRVRATDNTGIFTERAFVLEATSPDRSVVINEIHYNPPENTIREEFIELFNPSNAPVNLSSWRLRGAVDFVFTNGTTIPANGYLVVAAVPSVIQARYGVAARGPWTGGLSSDGETVTLRDATDAVVDEVAYKSEFPWPIAANGNGSSMELINPDTDNNLGSSWASPLNPAVPSPGAKNQVFATNAAPNIRQVNHTPQKPASTNQVIVTAKITDPQGVASVVLNYQVVTPGNFIPAYIPFTVAQLNATPLATPPANPAFEAATNWTAIFMHDDGMNGDQLAGDDVYTAVLPVQPNRTLVRYRITSTDALGASRRAPFADDPSLNFAYFVYDGIPAYGSVSAAALQTVPIYFLLTRSTDLDTCTAYTGANQIPQFSGSVANEARFTFNWPGAMVYDGEVYDHIRYRLRGANGRYQNGKRNFRFRFNDGRSFAAKDEFGQAYARKWSMLNTAKGQSNRETVTFSLNEYLNYYFFNLVGVPAPYSHYFHWRIVRGAQEAPAAYTGDFYGAAWAQEDYDADFLEAHHLPKGNLYKLINAQRSLNANTDMVQQRRYQGSFACTNGEDAVRIQNMLLSPTTAQTDAVLLANVNYTNWYAYHTICEAVRNYDTWPSANKNAAWFFDTTYTASNQLYGRFWTMPWDLTDTWGPTWNAGQDLAWNGMWGTTASIHTNMQRDYRNTMREIRDLLFQPDQVNPLIDAIAARLAPIAPADLARWSLATPSGSSYSSIAMPGPGLTSGLPGYVSDIKTFMFTGGSRSWWIDGSTVAAGGWITRLDTVATDVNIPTKPTIYYVGQTNYPMNSLTFECLPFADPQGASTFAAMQWRLAEVFDTNHPPADPRVVPPLEWNALWHSGTLTTWSNRITFPGQFVQTNKLYRARVRHQDNTGRWSKWSAPVQFNVTPADLVAVLGQNLQFSEIMYNPPPLGIFGSDDLEFLELQNIGSTSLDLSGLTFTAGIAFTFTNGTTLGAGQRFLLGRNAVALQTKYPGLIVNGIYTGKLDNGGETLRLSTPSGVTVLEVTYKDSPPWPVTADGMGWSLVLVDPVSGSYRNSTAIGGSPGEVDAISAIPPIVINELLTHTDPPQIDTIELQNPTATAVNIGGWFLTDKSDVPKKFRIPNGTIIGAGGYLTFNQNQYDASGLDFNLNSLGDEVYLFSGDAATNLTGYIHGVPFGAAANGVSFGRYVNSMGVEDFIAQSVLTLGTNNARPLIGPVVISEIMFQPPLVGTNENYDAEFIELQNVAATNVPLYLAGFPTNTWKLGNALTYNFPTNVLLPVGARLLVVGFNPATNAAALAAFRATYGLSTNTPIYGPWSGHLDNSGESVELKFPDRPELDGNVPYVMVEKISYLPVAPWPVSANGSGQSLQRVTLLDYANDPANWFAAMPSAGSLAAQTSQDVDGDGVPDLWEMQNGTDPFTADGLADADGDGSSNYAEWLAGTDPQNSTSYLHLQAAPGSAGQVALQFTAMANRSYTLQQTANLENPGWFKVADIATAPTNRVWIISQSTDASRFFRLVAPAQP